MTQSGGARAPRVHDVVRADILRGSWMPGERLQPAALAARYTTSTTVVREALTRLAGENFIDFEPNRGFFVPALSLDVLRDLTEVRCLNEALAIELALQRGDLAWESRLTAAHHTLSRTPMRDDADPEHTSEAWTVAHHEFHQRLIEACGVPVLIDLANRLSDSTALYRRWAGSSDAWSTRDPAAEHAALLAAALDRNGELAARLLREHYERTVGVVLMSGLIDGVEAAAR